jgi:hypothetical protein
MQQPTLSRSALALLLPLHHVPLSCMQLLSYQACHLLPSISSPSPCPHCVPGCAFEYSSLGTPHCEPQARQCFFHMHRQ